MWRVGVAIMLGMSAFGCEETRLVPRTVDEDPGLPAAEWNGSRFHLVRTGAVVGIPVIFLAGGPGNDFTYLSRLDTTCDGAWLGEWLPLVWWDQRGVGLSRRHGEEHLNLDTFRADLDGLVSHVDPAGGGVVLVGHSWGGMFAADFADRHPERVRGLVLIEPGELTQALLDDNPTPGVLEVMSEVVNDFAWGQHVFALDDHDTLDFYLLLGVRGAQTFRVNREDPPSVRLGGAVIRTNMDGGFYPEGYDFTRNLKSFSTETLVIAGDTPTSDLGASLQRRQLDVFAKAVLEVIPGAGHTEVVWADGCRSAELIAAYLRRVEVLR